MNKKERQAIAQAASPTESLLVKLQVAYKWMKLDDDVIHFWTGYDKTYPDRNKLKISYSKVTTLPVLTDEEVLVFVQHKGNYNLSKNEYDGMIRKLTCSMMWEMV